MDKIVRINCKSDFDFQYKTNELGIPFKFTFFTIDEPKNKFVCSFDGEEYHNCTLIEDEGEYSIIFHVDGGYLYPGNLRIRREYYIDSASFSDGVFNLVNVEKTNVYLVEEGFTFNSVVYEGSNITNFDYTHIIEDAEDALIIADQVLDEANDIIDNLSSYNLSYFVQYDDLNDVLGSYVTKQELSSCGYLTSVPDNYATKSYVASYVNDAISGLQPEIDLSAYVTKTELSNCGYITSIPSEYITSDELSQSLDPYVTDNELNQALEPYITEQELNECGYATTGYVADYVQGIISGDIPPVDLSAYVTKTELSNCGYITSIPDTYATKTYVASYVNEAIADIQPVDLSTYVTKTELSNCGYITSIPSEYITETELSNMGYLTSVPNNYPTYAAISAMGYITSIPSEYITETELSNCGYLTSVPDTYATKTYVTNAIEGIEPVTYNTYSTSIWVGTYAQYQLLPDYTTYQLYLIEQE